MSRFKIEFVTLYREFVDHLAEHQPPNYKFIIDMDASICKVVEHFPPAFTNPAALTPNARNPNVSMTGTCKSIMLTPLVAPAHLGSRTHSDHGGESSPSAPSTLPRPRLQ